MHGLWTSFHDLRGNRAGAVDGFEARWAAGGVFPGKLLPPPIALQNHQPPLLDYLVGRETMSTSRAFATTTNGGPFSGRPRVDHLIILTPTLEAAHNSNHSIE